MNIGIRCVFEILISFPLGAFPLPRSKIAESQARSVFNFEPPVFSVMTVPIYMPTISVHWLCLLHVLNNTFHLLTCLIVMIPTRCEVMSYCGLDLMISEAEPLFTYLTPVGPLYIFFGKLSFRSFSLFLNWVIQGGGCCCIIRVPYVFWISIPCWMWGQWIFSSVLWIALSFCSSLCCTETS